MTQPEVIYAHVRNLTSVFDKFAHSALKPWFATLQAKCSRLVRNRGR